MVPFSSAVTSRASAKLKLELRLAESIMGAVEMRTPVPPAPPYTLPARMPLTRLLLTDPPGEARRLRLEKELAMVVEALWAAVIPLCED